MTSVYVCLSCMRQIPLVEVWQAQETERPSPTYTHHTADGHPVVRIDGLRLAAAAAGGDAELRALVREWQAARRPAQLPAPGVDVVATYHHAVQRMAVADELLARFNLDGPAGGALVGQRAAPIESTGPYTDEYAVEVLTHLARTLPRVDEQHSCLRGVLAIKAIAARAQAVGHAHSPVPPPAPVSEAPTDPDACENCGVIFTENVRKCVTWDDIELCEACLRDVPEERQIGGGAK